MQKKTINYRLQTTALSRSPLKNACRKLLILQYKSATICYKRLTRDRRQQRNLISTGKCGNRKIQPLARNQKIERQRNGACTTKNQGLCRLFPPVQRSRAADCPSLNKQTATDSRRRAVGAINNISVRVRNVIPSSALYLASFPGLNPLLFEVLHGRSRQQLLPQADGDKVALQVDHGRIQSARAIDPKV